MADRVKWARKTATRSEARVGPYRVAVVREPGYSGEWRAELYYRAGSPYREWFGSERAARRSVTGIARKLGRSPTPK
jgi:hypothetical protein